MAKPDSSSLYDQKSTEPPIHWGFVSFTFLLGVCIAALGIVANVAWHWRDIWQYVFLDVGSAVALGTAMFVLQRGFVAQVRREGVATRAAVAHEAVSIERQLGEQASRIENLEERLSDIRSARREASDAAVAAARQAPSADSLAEAIRRAIAVQGIASRVRVRTSDDPNGLRFVIDPWLEDRMDVKPGISFTPAQIDEGFPQHQTVTPWYLGEELDTFVDRLITDMEAANLPTESPDLDLGGTLGRLLDTVELAIQSREGRLERRIQGHLVEVFDDEWLVTDSGVESRTRDLIIPAEEFYEQRDGRRPALAKSPPPPAGINEETWNSLVRAAHAGVRRGPPGPGIASTMF